MSRSRDVAILRFIECFTGEDFKRYLPLQELVLLLPVNACIEAQHARCLRIGSDSIQRDSSLRLSHLSVRAQQTVRGRMAHLPAGLAILVLQHDSGSQRARHVQADGSCFKRLSSL